MVWCEICDECQWTPLLWGCPAFIPVIPPTIPPPSLLSDSPVAYEVSVARVNEHIDAVLQEGYQLVLHVLSEGGRKEGGQEEELDR